MDDSRQGEAPGRPVSGAQPTYCPRSPDSRTIMGELIAHELRTGRLTPARRARLTRFAGQIGFTAVETNRLIVQARDSALNDPDARVRAFARLLVDRPAQRFLTVGTIAGIIGLAILLDLILLLLAR